MCRLQLPEAKRGASCIHSLRCSIRYGRLASIPDVHVIWLWSEWSSFSPVMGKLSWVTDIGGRLAEAALLTCVQTLTSVLCFCVCFFRSDATSRIRIGLLHVTCIRICTHPVVSGASVLSCCI